MVINEDVKRKRVKLRAIQLEPILYDKDANLRKILKYVEKAEEDDVDLILFPELAVTGYNCKEEFYDLAEPIPGPTTEKISEVIRDDEFLVILGMPERKGGLIYNSAAIIGSKGTLETYRKNFLPTFIFDGVKYEENVYFKEGSNISTPKTNLGKLGVEICYDFWFPEIERIHALRGSCLLINISGAPIGVPPIFRLLSRVRAVENASWFAFVNQVGEQEDISFGGGSCIVNIDGEIVKEASMDEQAKEEALEAELDLDSAMNRRLRLPVLRDVRPEILREAAETAENMYYGPSSKNME